MAKAELFEKDLPESERIFYYESETDDPIRTEEQGKKKVAKRVELPEDYIYIQKNIFKRFYGFLIYRILKIFGFFYAKYYLHMTIKNRKVLKKAKGKGYVIYANHTNPFHDVFSPGLVADRHIYTIALPANLFVPFIGKLLPYAGIIPLGSTPKQKEEFHKAIDYRLKTKNCLVIYPEAHVWPYATKIRKFPQGNKSFIYPARNNLPIFTMTTTYHKSKIHGQKRPDITVYLDGPFYPDSGKSIEENMTKLAREAYESMVKWSKKNSYEYFQYRRKPIKKD